MRLFQNSGVYSSYLPRLRTLRRNATTFARQMEVFLHDRFGAPHFLLPVLECRADAFFTNGDDEEVQRRWAAEQGMPATSDLAAILLAQIEHHRTEVFYNLDPVRFPSTFVHRLPACVKRSIAWRAAPSRGADFGAYDLVVCNFPGILEKYRRNGWGAAYFSPAHDPVMDTYAARAQRDVDVIFVGGYSRHHRRRGSLLEAVAGLSARYRVAMHLDRSSLVRISESPIGRLLPLGSHRRPAAIQGVSREPVFGRDLYEALSRAKIVVNGAIDMAGSDRGNMRCFEAMGLGCLLLTDSGRYPEGMQEGRTMVTYRNSDEALSQIGLLLDDGVRRSTIATDARAMLTKCYSKAHQWARFSELAA